MPNWLNELPASRLATLSFNLVVIGWLMLQVIFMPFDGPRLMPCAYLHPNAVNMAGFPVVFLGTAISLVALKRGKILLTAISMSLSFSVVCTLTLGFYKTGQSTRESNREPKTASDSYPHTVLSS